MARGRYICNTLKAIRKQIADANGIDYSPEECHFNGECKGTCPKCEKDVKNLEHELRLRKKAGKTIKVVGVALEMTALATSIMSCSTQKGYYNSTPPLPKKVIPIHFQEYTSKDSILLKERETLNKKGVLFVQGHIIDEKTKEPICTAFITAKLSGKKTAADIDGNFTIEVEQGDTITIKFIGMQDRIIKLSEMNLEKLNVITLTESNICNTLKAIRKQIADANGIDYSPEECNYKGECMGTCPKCEQDVRDLEYELHLRQMAGKAIKVAGIAAGLVAMTACSDGKVQRISSDATKSELNIVKKEEPKPGDRQLEGDISFSDEAKYAEEENRKLGEIPRNPRMEITKERTSNDRKGTTSKKSKKGNTALMQSAVDTDSIENSNIFGVVEEMPSFPGGMAALMKYIKDNLRYPEICREGAAMGRVHVVFIVNEDGSLSDIKVIRSISPELDKEAIRVVKSMPKWNPAKQNGKAVKMKYVVSVNFRPE